MYIQVYDCDCETWLLNARVLHKVKCKNGLHGITNVVDIMVRVKMLQEKRVSHVAKRTNDRWMKEVFEWYPRE